jgi:hypothetical protein
VPNAPCDDATLLAAIRQIFTQSGRDRMSSQALVAALSGTLDLRPKTLNSSIPSPTLEFRRETLDSQPSTPKLSTHQLARLLAPFGVKARVLRIDGRFPRGYRLADFAKPFDQFLDEGPRNETPNS